MNKGAVDLLDSITTNRFGAGVGRPTILVCIGMYRQPEPEMVSKLITTMTEFVARGTGYDLLTKIVTSTLVTAMRSKMVETMMSDPRFEYALFIDDDMDWPSSLSYNAKGEMVSGFNIIERLVSRDKDMVGALCFSRDINVTPMVGRDVNGRSITIVDPDLLLNAEPFQVDYIGFGMVMIKRCVFERALKTVDHNPHGLFRNITSWKEDEDLVRRFKTALAVHERERNVRDLMERIESIQCRASNFGEDYSFCKRARATGSEIWCDPSFDVHHIGKYPFGRRDWAAKTQLEAEQESANASNATH